MRSPSISGELEIINAFKPNCFFLLTVARSYLTECLGLKGDKEMLAKMYDSLRREYAAPAICHHKMATVSHRIICSGFLLMQG